MGFRSLAVVVLGCSLLAAGPATRPVVGKWRVKAGTPPEVAALVKVAVANRAKLLRDGRAALDLLNDELKVKEAGTIIRGLRGEAVTDVRRSGERWWRFKSEGAKQASIEETKAKLARTEQQMAELAATCPPPPMERSDAGAFKVGAVCQLSGVVKVLQVVDADNCRVEAKWWVGDAGRRSIRSQPDEVRKDLWLTGYPTASLTDGELIKEPIVVYVSGTKQYRTAIGGTQTVLLARPFKVEDWIEPAE